MEVFRRTAKAFILALLLMFAIGICFALLAWTKGLFIVFILFGILMWWVYSRLKWRDLTMRRKDRKWGI